MTLNEFLLLPKNTGSNIFDRIRRLGGLDFLPPVNFGSMNSLLTFKYGNKPIDTSVENANLSQLADMVVMLYTQLWIIDSGLYDVLVEGSGGEVIKVTESTDKVSERVSGGSSTDKVSAFNSDVMVDDLSSEQTGNEDLTESGNKVVSRVINNPIQSFNLLENHVKNSIIGLIS